MRKITKQAISALYSFRNFRSGNDQVAVTNGGTEATMYLHGNAIANLAKLSDGTLDLEITTAGWNTPTTFSRLNGLPGVKVNRKNWSVYLNGAGWDGAWTTVNPAKPSEEPSEEPFDLMGGIVAFESGELDSEATLALFQNLINTGAIYHLQGSYGRTAASLIEQGLITVGGAR